MPQVRFTPDPEPQTKDGVRFTPEAPSAEPSLMDRIGEYLPSPRTAFQVGGATIGGALGSAAAIIAGPMGTVGGGAVGAGLGEGLYQAIQRWRGAPDAPQSKSESLGQVGSAMSGGALQEGLGEALPRIGSTLASKLYRTALKPSTALTTDEAAAVSNNLLKERIPISDGGMRKLNRVVQGINGQIDSTIAGNPTAEVSPFAVAKRVDPAIRDFQYKDLQRDLTAAEAEKARFVGEHSTPVPYSPYGHTQISTLPPGPVNPYGPSSLPPVQTYPLETPILAPRAQAMKKAIWQELAPNDFGTVAEGYKQARKAEGLGLKEELQNLFPNIEGLNAREGRLLEGRPQLQRAINRTENRDVIGIGAPILAGAANVLTENPILAAAAAGAKYAGSRTAILADILSHPQMGVTPAALPRFGVIPLQRRIFGSPTQ